MNAAHRPAGPTTPAQGIAAGLLIVPAALAALCAACAPSQDGPRGQGAVPVTTAVVEARDVPIEEHAIGTVEAYSTVEVRAQVGGVLEKVHFREGQDVRSGDLLFTLDARPFKATLESAEAALARDTAQLETARHDVERYGELVQKEYVTQEEYDRIRTSAATLAAAVRADKAAIDSATVSLGYCTIRSPIDGRTGQLMVHAGNLVKANADTAMVTINQVSPIYVGFSVPERDLPEIRARREQGTLAVVAMVPHDDHDPVAGDLTFLDNAVDRSTGTVLLKATFANRDRALWPGQFVDVSLRLSTRAGALVIPSQALQTGQQGQFVFVVKADHTVESRPVVPGQVADGMTLIEKGLAKGEIVVTDGQLRLVPGTEVAAVATTAPPAPDAAPGVPVTPGAPATGTPR
jgi:multidrug efflux system membrane fusion protein